MPKRKEEKIGRPWKSRRSRRENWRASREFAEARRNPEPVKVLVRNGRTVDGSGLPALPGKPPSILPDDRLVTFEEIEAAYQEANAGRVHGPEIVQGGDPPW